MAMIAAGFTGGEAEELRRAFGFKRSEARMKDIEKKLRAGMNKQGIAPAIQDKIVLSITSFALYGFPESHAASFALIAYASAYLKCHYLAAFTAAILNNQPMSFYNPATLVKDAQRHGLKVKPIDITASTWKCTLERMASGPDSEDLVGRGFSRNINGAPADGLQPLNPPSNFSLRLGMNFVKCLRAGIASEIIRERNIRPFASIDDLRLRIPAIQKSELTALAEIGALNSIAGQRGHRRSALWQVERTARPVGPLLESSAHHPQSAQPGVLLQKDSCILGGRSFSSGSTPDLSKGTSAPEENRNNDYPLAPMTPEERLLADFRGTGLTVGLHPMAYHRATLKRQGVRAAIELRALPDGVPVRIAGSVIARQRPGTAKGFVFLSLEDETGIVNAIITPQLFTQNRVVVVNQQFLLIDGVLQNQDNVVSVKAQRIRPLTLTRAATPSHDFH
jgi:error-prone DNA polymerase